MTMIKGWVSGPLGNILTLNNDKSKQIKSTEYAEVGDYPVVDQSANFICGYHDDATKLVTNNLPFTVFGDHTRHTKFINFPFIAGADGTQLLKQKSGIDDKFFYYLVYSAAEGIGNFGYDRHFKHLKEFVVQYPSSLIEQSKIAEVLSTVDKAIEQTEEMIAKQQRIKTGLMQDLLTRGIDEDGNLRSEETHEFKDSPLGRIPVEWEVKAIESISAFVTSGARNWAKYYSLEGALFLRIGNLTRDHINLRLDDKVFVKPPLSVESERTSVIPGDLLVSVTADLGIIGVIPDSFGQGYVNQHISLIRLLQDKVNSRFVGWFLQGYNGQEQFEQYNESGAKAGLNLPTIRSLLVAYPHKSEQIEISKILDANNEAIDKYLNELQKLHSQKTALMQDLLTGKVRVTPLLNNDQNQDISSKEASA